MRIEAVPEEGRDFMSAHAWATICVTNFEEAIETRDEAGDALPEGDIRWIEA